MSGSSSTSFSFSFEVSECHSAGQSCSPPSSSTRCWKSLAINVTMTLSAMNPIETATVARILRTRCALVYGRFSQMIVEGSGARCTCWYCGDKHKRRDETTGKPRVCVSLQERTLILQPLSRWEDGMKNRRNRLVRYANTAVTTASCLSNVTNAQTGGVSSRKCFVRSFLSHRLMSCCSSARTLTSCSIFCRSCVNVGRSGQSDCVTPSSLKPCKQGPTAAMSGSDWPYVVFRNLIFSVTS